jgi:16S rRNA processing protein RimM
MAVGNNMICVGMIAGVHGVKGLVKLQSFTEPFDALADYPVLDENGTPISLQIMPQPGGKLLGQMPGLTDRTEAEKLRGKRLYVQREDLPEPDEGEYYHTDLIGMEARSADGAVLGQVLALHNFGASDIVEIGTKGAKSFMVPFTDAFVPEVDVDARFIVVAAFEEVE